jgi:hypothetical protein
MLEINGGHIYLGKAKPAGGGTITVDDALSLSSKNPVQNKVITAALNDKQDKLDGTVYTTDNLVGGDYISIVEQVGDPNTVALWDFEEGTADVVSGITATYGTPVQNSNAKFGNYGMIGTSGGGVAYPLSSVLSGTQQITLDWWQLCTKSYFDFVSFGISTSNNPFNESDYYLYLTQNNSADVTPYVNGTPTSRVTLSGATPNRYDHYCLTLDADTGAVQFFYNGVRLVNTTVTPFTIDATNLKLVKVGDAFTYVDEIRVSNCIRWTEDFTPPTEPYNFGETVYKINNLLSPSLTWYSGTRGNTLTIADTSAAKLVKIYKNGILLQPSADYTISGTTLTMDVSLVETDKIALEVI